VEDDAIGDELMRWEDLQGEEGLRLLEGHLLNGLDFVDAEGVVPWVETANLVLLGQLADREPELIEVLG
jgi:hypothetical protein